MTRMLVRVADAAEGAAAAAAGVDAVEMHVASDSLAAAHPVRAAFPGIFRLRPAAGLTQELVTAAAALPVDEIALPLADTCPAAASLLPAGLATVAVVAADQDRLAAIASVKGLAGAIMLETGGEGRLVDAAAVAELDAFAFACRAAALPFGLAGGLEAPDVARLLLLEPDVLGFDRAVRHGHRADGALDRAALDAIRALIPRHGAAATARPPALVSPALVAQSLIATDRIFVRDLVVPLSIGAYKAEHGARQRVRFTVEADVLRAPVAPHDMRDVFSYDVIIETIRVLAQRPHVTFVETLAEEIAASLIAHPSLSAVTVKVEKLDVIEGSVGIEITRRRSSGQPPA